MLHLARFIRKFKFCLLVKIFFFLLNAAFRSIKILCRPAVLIFTFFPFWYRWLFLELYDNEKL
jgi:hypothetical protein